MNRRQFTKRAALTVIAAGLSGSAFKCSSEKISIYVQTISTFLNQISSVLPAQSALITKVLKIASDFDAAYRRGDFLSADGFFNSLVENLNALTQDIGVGTSNTVKTWLAIIGAAVTSIAVLLKEQVDAQPAVKGRASIATSARAVERLASQAAVDRLYQVAKP